MRYFRLPHGIGAVSVEGISWSADEQGRIAVLPGTPESIIETIKSPNGCGAVEVFDVQTAPATAVPSAPQVQEIEAELVVRLPEDRGARARHERAMVMAILRLHGREDETRSNPTTVALRTSLRALMDDLLPAPEVVEPAAAG